MRPRLLFLAIGTPVLAKKHPDSDSVQDLKLKSCAESYGPGSVQCGPPNSGYCYNPSLGQTCCELDFGFCNKGTFCAPVAGHCCDEEQTLEACAQDAGFTLPISGTITRTKTMNGEVAVVESSNSTPTESQDKGVAYVAASQGSSRGGVMILALLCGSLAAASSLF